MSLVFTQILRGFSGSIRDGKYIQLDVHDHTGLDFEVGAI